MTYPLQLFIILAISLILHDNCVFGPLRLGLALPCCPYLQIVHFEDLSQCEDCDATKPVNVQQRTKAFCQRLAAELTHSVLSLAAYGDVPAKTYGDPVSPNKYCLRRMDEGKFAEVSDTAHINNMISQLVNDNMLHDMGDISQNQLIAAGQAVVEYLPDEFDPFDRSKRKVVTIVTSTAFTSLYEEDRTDTDWQFENFPFHGPLLCDVEEKRAYNIPDYDHLAQKYKENNVALLFVVTRGGPADSSELGELGFMDLVYRPYEELVGELLDRGVDVYLLKASHPNEEEVAQLLITGLKAVMYADGNCTQTCDFVSTEPPPSTEKLPFLDRHADLKEKLIHAGVDVDQVQRLWVTGQYGEALLLVSEQLNLSALFNNKSAHVDTLAMTGLVAGGVSTGLLVLAGTGYVICRARRDLEEEDEVLSDEEEGTLGSSSSSVGVESTPSLPPACDQMEKTQSL